MECIWQFAKIYKRVPPTRDGKTGWKWPEEIHFKTKKIKNADGTVKRVKKIPNDRYWAWRKAGMNYKYAVRYPVGFAYRHECIGHLWSKNASKIPSDLEGNSKRSRSKMIMYSYKSARIHIYSRLYIKMARKTNEFKLLRKLLKQGYNLQILDVDGPDINAATDLKTKKVKKPYDQIPKGDYGDSGVGSIEINEKNTKLLLNDTGQPFGHGYVLAVALLKKSKWIFGKSIHNK
jgi:hypothetical protein